MFRLSDGTLVLAATDITAHLACPHLMQQRIAVARGERAGPYGPADPHGDLVRRRGEEHERDQLATLRDEAGGDIVMIDSVFERRAGSALDEAAAQTAAAMRSGAPGSSSSRLSSTASGWAGPTSCGGSRRSRILGRSPTRWSTPSWPGR